VRRRSRDRRRFFCAAFRDDNLSVVAGALRAHLCASPEFRARAFRLPAGDAKRAGAIPDHASCGDFRRPEPEIAGHDICAADGTQRWTHVADLICCCRSDLLEMSK